MQPAPLFTETAPHRKRTLLLTLAVLVAIAVVGGAALVTTGGASTGGYRTATVATRSVDQQLTEVGTVEPVSQATVAFPVSGTVANVDVAVGQQVAVGRQLASLDTTSLQATVTQKQAALDQAELTLQKALAGESVSSAGGTSNIRTIAFTPNSNASSAQTSSADPQLMKLQQAVISAQQQVDSDLLAAQHALEAAETTCSNTSTTTTTSTTSSTTSTTTPTTTPDDSAACSTALNRALAAQQQLATSQNALVHASNALNDSLAKTARTPSGSEGSGSGGSGGGGTTNGGGQNSTGGGNFNGGNGGSGGNGAASPSAEDLVSYQKAVDAASLELAVAQQAVAQATISTPIAGTVAQVGFAKGDSVTSASTTQNVVIVGAGGYEVTTSIGVDDLRNVAVGQTATIRPDGSSTSIRGKVVSIGLAGDTTSTTTTYPVVIGITGDASSLRNGQLATVTIVTKSSTAKLAVPTSAVTTNGNAHTVRVLEGGKAKTVTVSVGAVGDTWTEVTRGLTAGQTVVLADLGEPLPNSATSDSNGTNGNRGATKGFPAGGFFRGPNG